MWIAQTVLNSNDYQFKGLPQWPEGKASACNAGGLGSIPGLGRSPGEGNDNPLQYSCLENPMDGEAWQQAKVHWITNSRTGVSNFTSHQLQASRRSYEKMYITPW